MKHFETLPVDGGYTITTDNVDLSKLITGVIFKKKIFKSRIPVFSDRVYYKAVVPFDGQNMVIIVTDYVVKFRPETHRNCFDVSIQTFSESIMRRLLSVEGPTKPDTHIVADLPDGKTLIVGVDVARSTTYQINVNCIPTPYHVDIDLSGIDFSNPYYEYYSGPKLQAIEDLLDKLC